MTLPRPARAWWPWATLAVAFALSRGAAFASGVRFDSSSLEYGWQFLAPELLRTRLAESLFYLHTQPPLFNLYLGCVLKVAGSHASSVFAAVSHAVGLALHASVLGLLLRLGVRPVLATGATLVLACSATSILHESWLFYEYPLAALLAVAACLLARLVERPRAAEAFAFGLLLAAACWTRSLFHPIWLVIVLAGVTALMAGSRRRVAWAFAPAVLLVLALCGKNAALFGFFGSSSWLGMSLCRVSTARLDAATRDRMIAEGDLSPLAAIPPYSVPGRFPADVRRPSPWPVRALTDEWKSPGNVNFDLYAYLAISETYLRDARVAIVRSPATYARAVGQAWLRYLAPPTDDRLLSKNRAEIARLVRVEDLLRGVPVAWSPPANISDAAPASRASWLCALLGLAALAWVAAAAPAMIGDPSRRAAGAVLLFAAFNVAWVSVVANALELGENNRFRVLVEPLAFTMLVVFVEELPTRWRHRRSTSLRAARR